MCIRDRVLIASPAARYGFEVPEARTSRWVEPRLVCSVRYKEFTHGGSRLRQPVFLRLRDGPLVLTRYPDGIDGKSFYQKDAPEWVPEWIRTESVWSESSEREIHYFVCDDVESLVYVVHSGTIPLHVWSSRVSDLARPDWCILDLDPKGAPFADVVAVALAIRRLCEDLELPTAVKTSGSTGLHI